MHDDRTAVHGTHPRDHNQPLGERCRLALIAAARAESEAERLERLSKRVFSQLVIGAEGSVSQREHAARCNPKFTAIEDEFIQAQTAANLAKAEADGLELKFKEWQSLNATNRAEMALR